MDLGYTCKAPASGVKRTLCLEELRALRFSSLCNPGVVGAMKAVLAPAAPPAAKRRASATTPPYTNSVILVSTLQKSSQASGLCCRATTHQISHPCTPPPSPASSRQMPRRCCQTITHQISRAFMCCIGLSKSCRGLLRARQMASENWQRLLPERECDQQHAARSPFDLPCNRA